VLFLLLEIKSPILVGRAHSIASSFERQAAARPEAVAVEAGERRLTYARLDQLSNQLAHRLRVLGVCRGEIVGVIAERGLETVVAALGTLKAGAAYSPMDPESPLLRIRQQLSEARARAAVAPAHLVDRLDGAGLTVVPMDPAGRTFASNDTEPPWEDVDRGDLFAVIFTSGSTGRPKGVAIEHGNMLNLLEAEPGFLPWPGESALQVCAPQFDFGAYEIWATLLAGGRLVCHPPGRPEPAAVCATVVERNVTWAAMATGIFHQLVEHGAEPLAGMRLLLVGGEPMIPAYARRFRAACPHTRLVNIYGPAETTVFACAHEVDEEIATAKTVPVGRAAAGARLHVLDEHGSPVPAGEAGELWVGGPGIARGYLHRPDLTAERFVLSPFGDGDRLYRSGDIVRDRGDGVFEIFGRLDDQVKVRGYRVEPSEVEAVLATHPDVRRAVVLAREDTPGHKRLVGYVVPGAGTMDANALRQFLTERLPAYMVPVAFVAIDRLPLTINGKVDRRALPAPPTRAETSSDSDIPASPLTADVARVFAEVLGLRAVDPNDDFLALGGDSLLGVQVLVRLREVLGVELPLAAVFEARTAKALAARAEAFNPGETPVLPPLLARQHSAPVPATASQAKTLLIGELAGESLPYQSQAAHRLIGEINVGALERSLTTMVARHEILRTTFERSAGVWVQQVHEPWPARLVVEDVSGDKDPEQALQACLAVSCRVRLDPARLPLARWSLVRLGAADHALIMVEHHVVHDGVTTAGFLNELAALYADELAGRPPSLPPPTVQYRDFAVWQAELVRGEYGRRTLAHWRERLAGAPAALELPVDRRRAARQTYRGDTLRMTLSDELALSLRRRARACGTTPFAVMLSAYCALLARYGACDEVVVGSGLANRRTLASEQVLGMVVNTVALRVGLCGKPTVPELIKRVHATVLDAQAHQDVPFENVVEHLAPARSANTAPLYQTLFSFHDAAVRTLPLPGGVLIPCDVRPNGSAKADLNVVVIHRRSERPSSVPAAYDRIAEDGLTVVWEYNRDLFYRTTAERMLGHYRRLLEQFAAGDDPLVEQLALVDGLEREQLLALSGHTAPYERDATVAAIFEARVGERPNATAVSFGGDTLSYRQLDRRANRLANHLRDLGVTDGARVAVCLERSLDLVLAFVAIAKAGAAYVPLDPADPPDRLRHHLDALGIDVVLTHARHREQLSTSPVELVCLDERPDLAGEVDSPPSTGVGPKDAVYVMFTSGSTGTPRGVEVPHRAVLRLARGADYVRLGPEETLLGLAPAAFDASTFEIWGTLLNGGRLVLAPPGALAPGEIADLVVREGVTTLWLTAGLFHRVVDDRPELLRSLRQLLAGGDVLSPDHVRRALNALPKGALLINGYGPTEGTTFTSTHRMAPGDVVDVPVPIGRPIANTRVYILDATGELAPLGVTGDLCIGGDGVALGYAGEPALSAERFPLDPFSSEPGARMYRSGDRARWRSDGVLEFLGRADRQIKVRGFRIEPVEVEEAIRSHPGIADVCVTPYSRKSGDSELAAYVVAWAGADPTIAELRAHAARILPAHAIPAAWSRLERLPLTANGKVDVAALPVPQIGIARAGGGESPPDEFERQLIMIWERALGVDAIRPDDDFFDLGGHSLLAVQVFDAVERTFGRRLPLATIFEASTVRRLAMALREDGWELPQGSLVTLTQTGTRPPLFFVSAGDGNSVGFGALARRLGPDQPLYVLQQQGINGGAPLHVSVEAMAAHYVREIRRVRPHGPYLLGGRCLGGVVAYEMARRLEARGEVVALVAVLDSSGALAPPRHPRLLADGTPFDRVMNHAVNRDGAAAATIGDVFSARGTARLLDWLAPPVGGGVNGTTVNRYLEEVYGMRSDLRVAFPDLAGPDARRFIDWAWGHGRAEFGLTEKLLPGPPRPLSLARASALRLRDQGVRIARRIAWRAGEAADLITRERRAGAAERRSERVRMAGKVAWNRYRAGSYDGVVTLIRSQEFRALPLLDLWHGMDIAGVVEREVPGSHMSMLREPDVSGLAACIRELVDQTLDVPGRAT
jgi:amino acid adenylation domain-containing protein